MRFFCDDDAILKTLEDEYGPGPVRAGNKMLTGEAKALLIQTLQVRVQVYPKRRELPCCSSAVLHGKVCRAGVVDFYPERDCAQC
eukprot:2598397-Rhodomonas_salina.1